MHNAFEIIGVINSTHTHSRYDIYVKTPTYVGFASRLVYLVVKRVKRICHWL